MMPLSALATVQATRPGPDTLDRFNNLPAGQDLRQRRARRQLRARRSRAWSRSRSEVLPADFSFAWSGASYQEKRASGASTFALGLAASWCS